MPHRPWRLPRRRARLLTVLVTAPLPVQSSESRLETAVRIQSKLEC